MVKSIHGMWQPSQLYMSESTTAVLPVHSPTYPLENTALHSVKMSPSRWRTTEFRLYYVSAIFVIPLMTWIPVSLSLRKFLAKTRRNTQSRSTASHPNHNRYNQKLLEGWVYNRLIVSYFIFNLSRSLRLDRITATLNIAPSETTCLFCVKLLLATSLSNLWLCGGLRIHSTCYPRIWCYHWSWLWLCMAQALSKFSWSWPSIIWSRGTVGGHGSVLFLLGQSMASSCSPMTFIMDISLAA